MGNYLSYFNFKSGSNILLDLTDAAPSNEQDNEAFDSALKTLESLGKSQSYLDSYVGNDELVQKVMKNPNDEGIRSEAFQGMFPNVRAIKGFYLLSKEIESTGDLVVRCMLREPSVDSWINHPELGSRLAQLLEGVFIFDYEKMLKSAVQNDFSFYRRELNKNATAPNIPVDDSSEASAISMFIAEANPMLKSLSTKLGQVSKSSPGVLPFLGDFANVCCASAIEYAKQGADEASIQRLVLSAVIASILYDNVDRIGAFAKSSPIDIKKLVRFIKRWSNDRNTQALSTLQYSSSTFDKAPPGVRKLFD